MFYNKNARDPRFCMGVVNLGVRNHCFLQQIHERARLGITREIHSRVPRQAARNPAVKALFG